MYIQFVSNDIRNLIFLELYIKLKIANANYLRKQVALEGAKRSWPGG